MAALELVPQVRHRRPSGRVVAEFEAGASNSLFVTMTRAPDGQCQNFSLPLLGELRDLLARLRSNDIAWPSNGRDVPVHYFVLRSGHPDYWSLGGDLAHFHSCIQRRDATALREYSMLCLDMMYEWATSLNHHATTIALVQGRALGGGFETALSADFLIAEEHSEFGFPEILFGLFPCTGGMSLLARRVGVVQAERLMSDGRIYSARELRDMGVVDEICPRGQGIEATQAFIASHAKRRAARLMLQRSRHRIAPLDYAELVRVVDEWVDTAMCLAPDELRVMDMLSRMQRGSGVAR